MSDTRESRRAEVDQIISVASRLCRSMGAVFVPDPEKISRFVNAAPAAKPQPTLEGEKT